MNSLGQQNSFETHSRLNPKAFACGAKGSVLFGWSFMKTLHVLIWTRSELRYVGVSQN